VNRRKRSSAFLVALAFAACTHSRERRDGVSSVPAPSASAATKSLASTTRSSRLHLDGELPPLAALTLVTPLVVTGAAKVGAAVVAAGCEDCVSASLRIERVLADRSRTGVTSGSALMWIAERKHLHEDHRVWLFEDGMRTFHSAPADAETATTAAVGRFALRYHEPYPGHYPGPIDLAIARDHTLVSRQRGRVALVTPLLADEQRDVDQLLAQFGDIRHRDGAPGTRVLELRGQGSDKNGAAAIAAVEALAERISARVALHHRTWLARAVVIAVHDRTVKGTGPKPNRNTRHYLRVERILKAPRGLALAAGDELVIKRNRADVGVREGDRAVWFLHHLERAPDGALHAAIVALSPTADEPVIASAATEQARLGLTSQ
jgi:hypothetical protein